MVIEYLVKLSEISVSLNTERNLNMRLNEVVMMKNIQFLVESSNGHDTLNVPENKLQEEVVKELNNDKWVTLEKKEGNSEILTKDDIPKKDEKQDWQKTFGADKSNSVNMTTTASKPMSKTKTFAKKFEKVKSATSTMKAKGG